MYRCAIHKCTSSQSSEVSDEGFVSELLSEVNLHQNDQGNVDGFSGQIKEEDPMFCCPKEAPVEPEIGADDSPVVDTVLCDISELPDGAKKEVEVNGRKLLLVNQGGNISCINALCSHYNFPLINGIFTEGKVRCPLHGACFNLRSGDIEEYPGFDAVNAFCVKREKGKLVLKATEKKLNSDRRIRKAPRFNENKTQQPLVVIGGGISADSLTENLRLNGCTLPITMITSEKYPPYDRVLLSKNLAVDVNGIRHRQDNYYDENKIKVMVDSKVVSVDTVAKKVHLENGSTVPYSKLVIASGGNVRKLTNAGSNLKNIYYIREYENIVGLSDNAKDKDVVVIGASFIGMESASAIKAVAKSVTIICTTDEPVPAFGRDVGASIRRFFESKGVKVLTKARVSSIDGANGAVKSVLLNNGSVIPADVVIAGIGVTAATDFLRSSPIKLDSRGFIPVNEDFQTSEPSVYAIGDVCSFPLSYWNKESINIQHFQVAQKHGELASYSLTQKPHPNSLVPFFWGLFFFEKGVRFAGFADDYDEIFSRGDIDNFDFSKYYIKNNEVIAVCNAGPKPAAIEFLEIFKTGRRITLQEVEKNTEDNWKCYIEYTPRN